MEMKINAKKVVSERTARAWTQQHLADASGLSLRTVQRVENNGTGSLETIKAIASCFDLDVRKLFHPPEQTSNNWLKMSLAGFSTLLIALGSVVFFTSSTMASDISISSHEFEASENENFHFFRGNVEIFLPRSIPLEVVTDSMWGNELASVVEGNVRVTLKDSTLVANKAIIINLHNGVRINTDYAEQHFNKTN